MSYPKRLKQPLKPQSSPTDHPSQSELIHHLRSDSELLAHEQAAFQPVLDNLSTDNDFLLSKLRIYKDSILKEPRPPGTGIGVGGSGSGSRSQTNQSGPDAVNDAFLSVTGLRHDQGQIPLRGIYGFDERQILKLATNRDYKTIAVLNAWADLRPGNVTEMKRNAFQKVAELVEMGLKLERAVDDAPDVKDAIKGFWVVMGKGDRGVD